MDLSKIKQLHIAIIGVVLILIAGALIYFMMCKPQQQNYAVAKARYDAAVVVGNEASLTQAKKQLEDAKKHVEDVLHDFQVQMKRRMPVLDFTKRDVGMIAMWHEQILKMGPLLEKFANDPNVEVSPVNFPLPAPPSSPNDSLFDSEVLNFQLGSLSATGDFRSLMNHIRRWNNSPRLVLVDGVSLSGNSPNLTVTYSIQCFVYPTASGGETKPMWGASSGGSGGGAPGMPGMGPGGPSAGMPGMGPGGSPAGMPGMGPGSAQGMPPMGPPT